MPAFLRKSQEIVVPAAESARIETSNEKEQVTEGYIGRAFSTSLIAFFKVVIRV